MYRYGEAVRAVVAGDGKKARMGKARETKSILGSNASG
jgi:hypothetical protein